MGFMQLQITQKGALYGADCARCGTTNFTHEWAHMDHNERRDAMQAGKLRCDDCHGLVDADTFMDHGPRKWYAGRYSAPGYMDCTSWEFDTNKRRLAKTLRGNYGDES